MLTEAIRGVLHYFKGNPSDEKLSTTRRILCGHITPEDRLNYLARERDRITRLAGLSPYTTFFTPPLTIGSTFIEIIQRLDSLHENESEVNRLLAEEARANLESWHALPRTPRVFREKPHTPGVD